jgi:hypothetical protein
MGRKIGDLITLDFTTHNPNTAQVQDADFIPTCQVFEDAADIPILTPLVVKRSGLTGDYRTTFTASAANGFEVDKSYNVIVEVTVIGITAKARIASFALEPVTPTLPACFSV